ncbi:hypothetical protein Ac2012v2_000137 [Leucoagaricus gongylophorus]
MADYDSAKLVWNALPPFAPHIPTAALPYLAFGLLSSTFSLAFYFTTLPSQSLPLRELAVASAASLLGGFGIVALFCSAGVYV